MSDDQDTEVEDALEGIGTPFLGLFFGTRGIGIMILGWYVNVTWIAILLVIIATLLVGVLLR